MKIERHLCDLCGGTIKRKEAFATLTVPDFDAPPAQRISEDASPLRFFISISPSKKQKSYDVCRGCVEGLLKARAYIKRAALERVYAQESESVR
jgi:hypothetical protein